MGAVDLSRFANPESLADAAAQDFCRVLHSMEGKRFCVALSGGRIARLFFRSIVRHTESSSWKRVQFFWGDERCVPPEDPERNYGLAKRELLAPLNISDEQVHRVRGELDPTTAAQLASKDLRDSVPTDADGWPVLDLIFLGMGEDGHVASLFPGESADAVANRAIFRPVVAPKPPPARITIGYGFISVARDVWVLASGAGKEEALKASMQTGSQTPLGKIVALRSATRVLTDITGV
jgi:6-phosphogluconolactonase